MHRISALWKANIVVFIGSFCVMVIELIAARILAPSIGVSLYTWTSIIGVILAGIALGNYTGGKCADKYPSPLLLVGVFFLGSLLTVAVMPFAKLLSAHSAWFLTWPLMLNFTLRTTIIFFLPAFILSMISPVAIKLALADLGRTGGVVGTIYAVSTTGAILGTFMTGFNFILWFGTRAIVWVVAGVLLLTGILALLSWQGQAGNRPIFKHILWAAAVLILVFGSLFFFRFQNLWQVNYARESNYYTINVYDEPENIKVLALDRLVHSYVIPDNPLFLRYDYLKIFAEIAAYASPDGGSLRLLHLGGGGYSFPRYMETVYPRSTNEVAEIDPAVTQIARERLGLPADTTIRTYHQDARLFLMQRRAPEKYDFVVGDVFNDFSTPYHLTTLEFDRLVRASLKPDGIYMINIIDDMQQGRYMPSFVHTLKQVFRNVFILGTSDDWSNAGLSTFVILATDRPLDPADYKKFATGNGAKFAAGYIYPEASQEIYLMYRQPLLLTDDHAPTDILIAALTQRRR